MHALSGRSNDERASLLYDQLSVILAQCEPFDFRLLMQCFAEQETRKCFASPRGRREGTLTRSGSRSVRQTDLHDKSNNHLSHLIIRRDLFRDSWL